MSVTLRRPMSIDAFLAWEGRQEGRHEFDGQTVVAMVGAVLRHEMIERNIMIVVGARLRGSGCQIFGAATKLRTETSVRYPDATITCGPLDPRAAYLTDPTVVFEVISPSTSRTDRIVKTREYFSVPSVQRYVMLEQDAIAATVLTRDGARCLTEVLTEGSMLELPETGVTVPLTDLYEGVTLEADDGGGTDTPA